VDLYNSILLHSPDYVPALQGMHGSQALSSLALSLLCVFFYLVPLIGMFICPSVTVMFCFRKNLLFHFLFGSLRYGDGAGNTVEENSSVFSLIRMR